MADNFRKSKDHKVYSLVTIGIVMGLIISLGIGSVYVPPKEIAKMLLSKIPLLGSKITNDWSSTNEAIVLQLRLPRVILAFLVGAQLSAAGVIYQGVFRNPMADPYIIGASAGASLGAALGILFFPTTKIFGIGSTPVFAFIGSAGTVFLVYSLASIGGRTYSSTLLLSGVAVSSFLSAIVSFFMYFSDGKLHHIYFWLVGSFASQGWNEIYINFPYAIIGFLMAYWYLRYLNILQLGEETAFFTGVDTERLKKVTLSAAALLTASAVAVSGVIGFVGLIIPHITRMIIGPDHRQLFPLSTLIGGLYLMMADTVSRVIIAPTELPVGVLTALFGGPFFIYLLFQKKNKDYRL